MWRAVNRERRPVKGSFYKLRLNRSEKRQLLGAKSIIVFLAILGVAGVIWLAWVRPAQREQQVNSYEQCRAAGYRIQESYPEVCFTPSGKRFVHPEQQKAHQASLDNRDKLEPPTNPELLYLEIGEWDVRIPLTMKTFDLSYVYIEDGFSERIHFIYKRLVAADICKTDVGLTLTRSMVKNEPPFTELRPAPSANVGRHYFYSAFADKPCYKTDDKTQAALVKEITGDKSLTETTHQLITKLEPIPEAGN